MSLPFDLSALGPLAEAVEKAGAPILAAALRAGSAVSGAAPFPLNLVLPTVLNGLADALGGDASDPGALAGKIAADPDAAVKIQTVEDAHKTDLQSALDFADLAQKASAAAIAAEGTFWGRFFVGGYRPAFGWSVVLWLSAILVLALSGYDFPAQFWLAWNPVWIAFGSLLLLRTTERFGGVAREILAPAAPAAVKRIIAKVARK